VGGAARNAPQRMSGLKTRICSSRQRLQLHSGIVKPVQGQIAGGSCFLDTSSAT
jgi:hypothetical protein